MDCPSSNYAYEWNSISWAYLVPVGYASGDRSNVRRSVVMFGGKWSVVRGQGLGVREREQVREVELVTGLVRLSHPVR